MDKKPKRSWMGQLALPLLGFGVLCLLTAFFLGFVASEKLLYETVPASGGVVGPFAIEEDGTVLDIEVHQNLPLQTWSFVTLSLLDQNKQWLIGFGDEFWHESGYDGGSWEQAQADYEATVTVPKRGKYYLKVKPQTNMSKVSASQGSIYVKLTTRGFSTIPHFATGIIAIILSLIFGKLGGGGLFGFLKET